MGNPSNGVAPLGTVLIRTARRYPVRLALVDEQRGAMNYVQTLMAVIALARRLRRHWGEQRRVGVLLPPSVGGALVNLAAALSGRVTVNLNYSAGCAGMEAAARMAGLETVVTSQQFVERARIVPPRDVRLVWLEEEVSAIGLLHRAESVAIALLAPAQLIARLVGGSGHVRPGDDSSVVFSSGSTGEPKGVPLSHVNVLSNVRAAQQVLGFGIGDRLVHLLPFFHAFGNFMLWAGIHSGAALILIPNPLDASAVGRVVERCGGTMMCATPSLLEIYRKRIPARRFTSLRIVVAGAEKLSSRTRAAFERHFQKPILEGYGCTECAPVIAVNAPSKDGNRRETVGRPLPGVRVTVVDPEGLRPLPPGSSGMLMVRGPNVMRGYLDRPDLSAAVLRDGWYLTGDIGRVDEDGFITITDRLARFSKVGGEMVSHGMIEELLHSAAGERARVFAVTSVHHEKKGEMLAVVHVGGGHTIPTVCRRLKEQGTPNLFIPKPRYFVRVDALPVLGSGKIDLGAVKRLAEERLAGH